MKDFIVHDPDDNDILAAVRRSATGAPIQAPTSAGRLSSVAPSLARAIARAITLASKADSPCPDASGPRGEGPPLSRRRDSWLQGPSRGMRFSEQYAPRRRRTPPPRRCASTAGMLGGNVGIGQRVNDGCIPLRPQQVKRLGEPQLARLRPASPARIHPSCAIRALGARKEPALPPWAPHQVRLPPGRSATGPAGPPDGKGGQRCRTRIRPSSVRIACLEDATESGPGEVLPGHHFAGSRGLYQGRGTGDWRCKPSRHRAPGRRGRSRSVPSDFPGVLHPRHQAARPHQTRTLTCMQLI